LLLVGVVCCFRMQPSIQSTQLQQRQSWKRLQMRGLYFRGL
jgi:uncharacterized protein (DUF2132 family)